MAIFLHVEHEEVGARPTLGILHRRGLKSDVQGFPPRSGGGNFKPIMSAQDKGRACGGLHGHLSLHATQVQLAAREQREGDLGAFLELRRVQVHVLVHLDGSVHVLVGEARGQVLPLVQTALHLSIILAVVRGVTATIRNNPTLEEPKGFIVVVELGVGDPCARGHVLDTTPTNMLLVSHGVLVGELARDDISHDLHVPMRMGAEATSWLHEVIVHDPKDTKVRVERVAVLREAEVEAALEPVAVGPALG
mmetsp:Transcript_10351/g.29559  ORF Transcript_10351/g.29559 Transcript_10351/m.29559 type:complete len:250 (-) Transcript_10351:224-973(-)